MITENALYSWVIIIVSYTCDDHILQILCDVYNSFDDLVDVNFYSADMVYDFKAE